MKAVLPALARQWHHAKNKPLLSSQVLPNSGKKAWWKCTKGHVWQASIHDRNKGTGCPKCKELKRKNK